MIMIGFLGQEPEKRFTPEGKEVSNFSLAVKERDKTIWFRCTAFGKTGEVINQYLEKGSLVAVEARLSAGDDGNPKIFKKRNGESGTSYEVIIDQVKFLSYTAEQREEQNQSNKEEMPF